MSLSTTPKTMAISRRKFFATPAAAAAGLALPGLSHAGGVFDELLETESATRLGYWLGSEHLSDFDTVTHSGDGPFVDEIGQTLSAEVYESLGGSSLVDPAALPTADPKFLLGAEVTVHGFHTTGNIESLPALELCCETPHGHSMHVWSLDADTVSRPVSFVAPVTWQNGLQLTYSVGDKQLAPKQQVRLAMGGGADAKLRRGFYLLVWPLEGPGAFNWSRYEIQTTRATENLIADLQPGEDLGEFSADNRVFSRLNSKRGAIHQAELAYLLLSIDYHV